MTDQTLPTDAQIKAALAAVAARPSVTDVYYVACGGSYSIMLPNQYAMDRHATSLAGHALNAAEFLARNPARLGASSVVILCSHSGTTPETVEAARFARAKGLSPLRVVLVHVLRNTLIPLVTVLGLELGSTIAYAVVTESIFAWPGAGKLILDSINTLDRPVVVAYLMVVVVIFVSLNLIVDVLYRVLDPRVRLEGAR